MENFSIDVVNELLFDSIYQQAKTIATNESILDVVRNAYNHRDRRIERLGHLLPNDQIKCLRISERKELNRIESLIILFASLQVLTGDVRWIHWNISKHLDALIDDKSFELRLTLLVHSFLAQVNFADEPSGQTFVNKIIARELVHFAPRDSVLNAIKACISGDISAFRFAQEAASALHLVDDARGMTSLDQMAMITQKLGVTVNNTTQKLLALRACTKGIFVKPSTKTNIPHVFGDCSHYIFKDAGTPLEVPAIKIYEFEDAMFSIDASRAGLTTFYVFTSSGECVSDLSYGFDPFVSDSIDVYDGALAILDDGFSGTMNICHFLLDKLTRVELYGSASVKPDAFLLVDRYSYYDDVFDYANMGKYLFKPSARRISIKVKRLLVSDNITSSFRHPAHMCAPWAINFLRTLFQTPLVEPGNKKLFISRNDAVGRKVLNSESLRSLLSKHGFEFVTLAGLSFVEQKRLFSQASHVIGVHGAGLTNILFSSEKCRIIEILPPFVATSAYWLLASSIGQNYSGLVADDPELSTPNYVGWVHNPGYNNRDVVVPLDKLNRLLIED
jgi:hypothetical protein